MTTRLTCGARLAARGREKEAARVHGPRVGPERGGRKGEGWGVRLGPISAAMVPLRELGLRGECGPRGRKGKGLAVRHWTTRPTWRKNRGRPREEGSWAFGREQGEGEFLFFSFFFYSKSHLKLI